MKKDADNKRASSQFLNTEGGKAESNAIEIPSISLPKGGGAIKGIDEKFSVNAVNGTASFSIPLPVSPARGASPSLALSYNSGSGNSPFGLGWNLSLPSIQRKTDKRLPQYLDEIDSDIFLFSEAEDLVPEFRKDEEGSFSRDSEGRYIIREEDYTDSDDKRFTIRFYRPRIEGLFARIERWSAKESREVRWRVITKDNVTTLFGWTPNSRLSDPNDRAKVFRWLPEFTFDDKGNCSYYHYSSEEDLAIPAEAHRLLYNSNRLKDDKPAYSNLYLDKILYGNKLAYSGFDNPIPINDEAYYFQTIFDYRLDYNEDEPEQLDGDWYFREDAFSQYKAGFEIRTTRLCKRVLLFHQFKELPGERALVKSLIFDYKSGEKSGLTFLNSISQVGYIKKEDETYTSKSLPPLEFGYQEHEWDDEVKVIEPDELIHAPTGLSTPEYHFTDLFSEGLSGILTEQGGGWYYKHNLGDGKFAQAVAVSPKPSFSGLGEQLQLMDLNADGGKQLVSLNSRPQGYFELDYKDEWQPFKRFKGLPNLDMSSNNIRMLDLNGDGRPDLLITEDNIFTWYESLGREGYEAARRVVNPFDEEAAPRVVFAEATQTVFLADMSGDGLTDIVRIRNGEVCYWPNLGYGRFGSKVAMDNAPHFDRPDHFNPSYIRLADIDGSGTTDIIYLGKNRFSCWLNLNGNSFSEEPVEIDNFPPIDNLAKVTVTDLLGSGVASIVWSSSLPGEKHLPLRYIDLMKSKKPHIMNFYTNNLGKEVSLEYAPSTKFYLEDRREGRPWVTKLHFPVHCLFRVETRDVITGYRFVTSYRYRHGYYDHAEREFRGFGMVEKTEGEYFEHWVKGDAANIVDRAYHQEPVVSRTWYHCGCFLDREKLLTQFEDEYWYEQQDSRESGLSDARLIIAEEVEPSVLESLSTAEWREALRACKGMVLHSELSSEDKMVPYSSRTQNCLIELLQPKGDNSHAVFVVKESEVINYNYEGNPADPRINHDLNIKVDSFGNVLESASVAYGKVEVDDSLPLETVEAQSKTVIRYSKTGFTDPLEEDDNRRLPLPVEIKSYELRGAEKAGDIYKIEELENSFKSASEVEYHQYEQQPAPGSSQVRLIEHLRNLFYKNDLSGALPLFGLESKALPYESYQLAYTEPLISDIFADRVDNYLMIEGRFVNSEADHSWWIRSGCSQYLAAGEEPNRAEERFYLPISFSDPYGAMTKVKYDNYLLSIVETEDALGNITTGRLDYRTLTPEWMRDMNDNISELLYDELGLVKAMAIEGKDRDGDEKGDEADSLEGLHKYITSSDESNIMAFLSPDKRFSYRSVEGEADADATNLLKKATARFIYDFNIYAAGEEKRVVRPAVSVAILREEHYSKNRSSPLQISFEYSNGLGQVIMKKVQAEPGVAKEVVVNQVDNSYSVNEINTSSFSPQRLRWIAEGRVVLNNRGNPVKQYEPYFSTNHKFENNRELVESGVTPILFYDAPGRLIRTELPDGTFSKTEFDVWHQTVYDPNDTILDTSWYYDRINRLIDVKLLAEGKDPVKEKEAAKRAAKHYDTPKRQYFDAQGRAILSIEHNRENGSGEDIFSNTRVELDIEGNLRAIKDDLKRVVMEYKYDMLGNKVYRKSMDAGRRWMLTNLVGNPLRTWDERGHEFHFSYDILQRAIESKVLGGEGGGLNHIFDRLFYGEGVSHSGQSDKEHNLRGKIYRHYDTGGLLETPSYDFKGQPTIIGRKLFKSYKDVANWTDFNLASELEDEMFKFENEIDALGRVKEEIAPDGTVIEPLYNEAGLLNGKRVSLNSEVKSYIKNIDYNEKGQRSKIEYGNGVITEFSYDKETFRLKKFKSRRKNGDPLQEWHYNYDPVGNITHIEDKNSPTIFFDNHKVTSLSTYTYDALYRLVEATGRENRAALSFARCDNWSDKIFRKRVKAGDSMAAWNYIEKYSYDKLGNIEKLTHSSSGSNSWTRNYSYEDKSNRLVSTHIRDKHNPIDYTKYRHHREHGYLEELPHLERVGWNCKEELFMTSRQHCTEDNIPIITYYQYDGEGRRIRKITENQAATGAQITKKEERIYLGSYELYKKHSDDYAGLERHTLSLMDNEHRFAMIETRNEIDDDTDRRLVRYQLHNHLGSVSLELDDSEEAEIISYEEYHPFGTTAYRAANKEIKAAAKRYCYVGKERDEETGLYYYGARYYIPWLGRWLSPDPAGLVDGVNLYAYVNNGPINKLDMNGLWEISWIDVAIGAGVALLAVGAVVVTAGLAGPVIAGGLAAAGVSKVTVGALATTAAIAGTVAGAAGTANTAYEVIKGETVSGRTLSDAERSRKLGALPVEAAATALGVRAITGGFSSGGGAPPLPGPSGSATLEFATVGVAVTPVAAAGAAPVTSNMMMSMMDNGNKGQNSTKSSTSSTKKKKRKDTNRESSVRRISRKKAMIELREALRNEVLTPRQREMVELIRDEYGAEAIEYFIEHGKFPKGVSIENSHPYSVQSDPQISMEPGDLIPSNYHRYGVHGGDTSIPLNGDPLAPNYSEQSGYLIYDESGVPIGQMGEGQLETLSTYNSW